MSGLPPSYANLTPIGATVPWQQVLALLQELVNAVNSVVEAHQLVDNTAGQTARTSPGSTSGFVEDTYTGGIGTTAYTLGEIVGALKLAGVLKP